MLSWSGACIKSINYLSDITEEDDSDKGEPDEVLIDAKVIDVHQLEQTYICLHYKEGKLGVQSGDIVTCELCNTTQGLHTSKKTAKHFLEGADITDHVTIWAYQDMLQAVAQNIITTPENLPLAPFFDSAYNEYPLLTRVTRHWIIIMCMQVNFKLSYTELKMYVFQYSSS